MLIINDKIKISLNEFELTFSRSSGPGGQNVNKVNSKATLHWNITQSTALPPDVKSRLVQQNSNRINNEGSLVVSSDKHRDQHKNIEDCLTKIQDMIERALHPPKKRIPTAPSQQSEHRRLEGKKVKSARKQTRKKVAWDN